MVSDLRAKTGAGLLDCKKALDETKGELAKAYVVPRQGATLDPDVLDAHCRSRMAAYKVPRAYQIVADLPKTSTGKILRRMLRSLDA